MKYLRKAIKSNEFGVIRILLNTETNEVYFSGKDIALGFGYRSDPGRAVRNYCKNIIRTWHISPGGRQFMNFINRDDIDRIVYHAKFSEDNVLFYLFIMNICEDAENMAKEANEKEFASRTIDKIASFCNEFAENGVGLEFSGLSITMPNGKKIRLSGTADA